MTLVDDIRDVIVKRGDLMRICQKRGIDVDDVVQTVIVDSLEKQTGVAFVEGEQRKAYAANKAKWAILDLNRRVGRRQNLTADAASLSVADGPPSPLTVVIHKHDESPIVAYVSARISADPMLRGIRTGASYAAAARDYGVSTSTVTRRRDRLLEEIGMPRQISTQRSAGSCVYRVGAYAGKAGGYGA